MSYLNRKLANVCMQKMLLLLANVFVVTSCNNAVKSQEILLNGQGKTICERIKTPEGFKRKAYSSNSFEYYLQHFPLKPDTAKVYYYNGTEKPNRNVYKAVLDIDIGLQDLQQCADAIIRLRAEYLFKEKQYDKISFNFTNGFCAEYKKWAEGYRVKVEGNKVSWYKSGAKDYSYKTFRKYLDIVFSYAGTLSLSKELKSIDFKDISVGGVLIQGGSPGHAVLVVDVAENPKTKQKAFLLVQSYMPAQNVHLLANIANKDISPWYIISDNMDAIETPEWTFYKDDLKRF